ncbi:N-acetylmuramoyl-L-alanine amidase [Anderseniella sp. Alg231-50]|uniref:N-acetylmuramoyl-L-alanine amidase n=1 Tax=Anderseniella sp. Alg231-50 TaxID=1922226 RepID=UPI00307BA116
MGKRNIVARRAIYLITALYRWCAAVAVATAVFIAVHIAVYPDSASATPPIASVSEARIAGDDARTRFVADLDRPVSYSVYVIDNPYRVVVDLPDVRFNMPPEIGDVGRGLVRAYRFGQLAPGKSRIVIDTTGPVLIEKSFVLNPENGQPARMIIDIIQTDQRTFARIKATERPSRNAAASPVRQVPDTLAELLKREGVARIDEEAERVELTERTARLIPKPRPKPSQSAAASTEQGIGAGSIPARPVVVLDPGHGGIDGGTVSRKGTPEKKVVLAFARELRKRLLATGRFEVHMTRNDDRFISLGKRVKFARAKKADLFIAVHADSLRQRRVRGATVYTLSEKASDAEAAALAEKENNADFIGGVDLGEDAGEVADILLDLALRETKNHSIYFARRVVKNLKPVTPLNRRPVRSAGFKVLRAPDVPSVLLELGYLSNRHDEKNLVSSRWRRKAAGAVTAAIEGFFSPEVAARQQLAQ